MKKRLAWVLSAILLLAGCRSNSVVVDTNVPKSTSTSAATESSANNNVPNSSPIQFWGETNGSMGAGCGTDAGYYYWQERGDTNATLMYIDYASKKAFPLCARPECAHSDESCTSWLGWRGGNPQLVANENNLLLAYSNTDTMYYEQYKEKALAHIEIAGLDGSGKRTLVTLQANENLQLGVASDDAYAYIIITTALNATESQSALYSVSLADGTLTKLYALPKGTSFMMGASGRNIVIKSFSAPEGDSLYSENDTQTFFCINVDTKECVNQKQVPFRTDASAVQPFVQGISLYSFSPNENILTVENLQTGEQMYKVEQVFDKQIQYGQLARVYGNRVVFSETFSGEENPTQIWLDLKSGERGLLTLTGSYGAAGHSDFSIMPSWSKDGLMLAVYRSSSKKIMFTDGVGASVEAVALIPDYAFISEQDFFSNNANFEPVA